MRSAVSLLQELGVTEPREIDVNAIATYCQADVRYRKLDGCEARLLGNGDRAIISVNDRTRIERQRFGVGHELGHWLGDRGRVSFVCEKGEMSGRATSPREVRANSFAADLLMPEYLFRPRVLGKDLTLDTVDVVAKEFTTSLRATALRLVAVGGRPAAVVVSDGLKRDWYRNGPDVPDALRPHRELQDGSGAHRLLNSGSERTEPLSVGADLWIDHQSAGDYEVVEHCIRVSATKIVTLLWWDDESQITDLLDDE